MKNFDWRQFFESIKDKDGNTIEIPLCGTLGLLAKGDVGVMAWKLRRDALLKDQIDLIIKNKQETTDE